MSIVAVPSRHLASLGEPSRTHSWGMGASARPRAKWSFGALGQYDAADPVNYYLPDPTYSEPTTGYSTPVLTTPTLPAYLSSGELIDYTTDPAGYDPFGSSIGGQGVTTSGQASWMNALTAAIGGATKVATVAELPAGSSMLANGTILGSSAATASAITSSLTAMLPLLLIGGVAFVVLSSGRGR